MVNKIMKIILDTNFLIYCVKEKFDYVEKISGLINESYELVVPLRVIEELERLKIKADKGKDKDAADLALKILNMNIKNKEVKKIETKGKSVDESIISLAGEDNKNIVCTLDREMRFSLPRVILINKGKKLILTR